MIHINEWLGFKFNTFNNFCFKMTSTTLFADDPQVLEDMQAVESGWIAYLRIVFVIYMAGSTIHGTL